MERLADMVERFKKGLESVEDSMKASICDENQIFVEGAIYGLEMAKAVIDSTARAYAQEVRCLDVKDE